MIEMLNQVAHVWSQWQWAMLWQVSVLTGLIVVIDRLIKRRVWPQLRYALWLLILVKLVLPPSLTSSASITAGIPTWTRDVMNVWSVGAAMATGEQSDSIVLSEPIVNSNLTREIRQSNSAVDDMRSEKSVVFDESRAESSEASTVAGPRLSWRVGLLGVWLVGVVFFSVGLIIRLKGLFTERHGSQSAEVPDWLQGLLERTAEELHLKRIPRVILTRQVCCPAVFGLFRPVLLIPSDRLSSMTEAQTRHILLHELAHIKRGDLVVHALHMALLVVYWFNPFVWLIRKPLQHLRELCCDATVARHLKEDTGAYRQTLLDTAKGLLDRSVRPEIGLLGLFENAESLETRLHWLTKRTWRHSGLRTSLVTITTVAMLYCILPMAASQAVEGSEFEHPFQWTMSNGVVIELVGVSECPSAGKQWWRPDGTVLPEAPYDSGNEGMGTDGQGGKPYEVAVKYSDLPENSIGKITIHYASRWNDGDIPDSRASKDGVAIEGLAFLRAVIGERDRDRDNTTVKVRVATGDWRTYASNWCRPGGGWGGGSTGPAIFARPYDRDGQMHMTITHSLGERETRVVVLDVNNVEHGALNGRSGVGALGVWQLTARFDVSMDEVAAVYLQARPYEQVEFRNVSLRPSRKRDVTTVSLGINTIEDRPMDEDHWVGRDQTTNRNESKVLLRQFYLGLIRYLNKHDEGRYPDRITGLEFKWEHTDVYTGGVWFIEHLGYFGSKGYRSLSPDQLNSNPPVPLAYCKKALEYENEEGTNVLFSDGHVEWIAAQELDALKSR